MNNKKAKKLRKSLKEQLYDENGDYKHQSNYEISKTIETVVYIKNEITGKIEPQQVKKHIIVNKDKELYKKAKKDSKKIKGV